MKHKWPILFLAATALLHSQPLPLSLKQAVDLALAPEGNARVRLAGELVKQSQSRERQALSALLPNVDASITGQNFTRNLRAFGVSFPANIPGISFPEVVGPVTYYDARVTATQSIFDFSAIRRRQAAQTAITQAEAEREAARNQVADQVARTYMGALRSKATIETAEANIRLANDLLKLAETQKDAGTGTGIEVVRAQVQRANEQQRLLVAQNELHRLRFQLLKLLGLPLGKEVDFTDKFTFNPSEKITAQQALESAHTMRAELKAQRLREDVARLNYSSVKSERIPSIGAYADYGGIGLSFPETRQTRTFAVTMRVPIFDGGRRDARRAESASQLRAEQIRTKDTADQTDLEVRLALDTLEAAENQAKVAAEGRQLAERELAQAQRRYQAGVSNSVELTDAQTRLERARDNYIAALFSYNLSRIDLATAMGAIHRIIQ